MVSDDVMFCTVEKIYILLTAFNRTHKILRIPVLLFWYAFDVLLLSLKGFMVTDKQQATGNKQQATSNMQVPLELSLEHEDVFQSAWKHRTAMKAALFSAITLFPTSEPHAIGRETCETGPYASF
jgi:hypothetical protein